MSLFYRALYRIGLTPWERMPMLPVAEQVSSLFDRVETGLEPPYGHALDLGCGSGIWAVELSQRGWQVTGIDVVPKAIRGARERARAAGVEARFIEGDAAELQAAGVGCGFRLVLDFGTVHGLSETQREAVARELSACTTADATVLMYAAAPGRRGPLPRGASRADIEAIYDGWSVIDDRTFDASGAPGAFRKAAPRWYRLRRQ